MPPASGGGFSGFGGGDGTGGGFVIGGGAGGGGACATLDTVGGLHSDTGAFNSSGYDEEDAWVTDNDGGIVFWVSEYYPTGTIPTAPRTAQLTATSWSACEDCVVYSVGCTPDGNCNEDYLAQSGTLEIDQQTLNADAGVFNGSVSQLHLVQWDGIHNSNTDGPTLGGKCLDITMGTFNGIWP
jgi:hypothetical protein